MRQARNKFIPVISEEFPVYISQHLSFSQAGLPRKGKNRGQGLLFFFFLYIVPFLFSFFCLFVSPQINME